MILIETFSTKNKQTKLLLVSFRELTLISVSIIKDLLRNKYNFTRYKYKIYTWTEVGMVSLFENHCDET